MPAFFTHYRFGFHSYKKMRINSVKKSIRQYPHSFVLGCQGPDLFFYSMRNYTDKRYCFSDRIHEEKTGEFFVNMTKDVLNKNNNRCDKNIKLAYLAGFLAHYYLDCSIHPYVYSIVGLGKGKETIGKHFQLESDIDINILKKLDDKVPSDFNPPEIISLSKDEKLAVSEQLYRTISKTYGDVLVTKKQCWMVFNEMRVALFVMTDKSGKKGMYGKMLEDRLFGYPVGSPLLYNDLVAGFSDPCNESHQIWLNPFTDKLCTDSVFDLFDSALEKYIVAIEKLDDLIAEPSNEKMKIFFDYIGNNSYKTGGTIQ